MTKFCLATILAITTLVAFSSRSAMAEATAASSAVNRFNVMIPMRDGVRLSTDVYIPSGDVQKPPSRRWPVLMTRTPYDKILLHEYYKTSVGPDYVLVIQDVRGTYGSEGTFQPMLNEGTDGFDTIAWLNKQPWSDGRVGTFGGSYMGGTQLLLAAERPQGLVASFAEVAATDQFKNEWVYMDGALTSTATLWSSAMVGDASTRLTPTYKDLLKIDYAALGVSPKNWQSVYAALTGEEVSKKLVNFLPLREVPAVRLMPWWPEWLDNWDNPQHFQRNGTEERARSISVPVMHVGGWYDLFLRNTYGNYENIAEHAKNVSAAANQRLLIGQWAHDLPACTHCEANATIDIAALQAAWMDRWFKGTTNPLFDYRVVLYVMGENRWRGEDHWPLAGTKRTHYYLHSQGRANTANGNGILSTSMPNAEPSDRYQYDPHDPASTLGWAFLSRARTEQNATEARSDVLVFSSPALTEDVEVTGEINATLYAASSATDTDWWMKLVDVAPDGKAYILTQGLARARYRVSRTNPQPLMPNKVEKYELNMWATSNVFKRGHRIRIEVTSSNFPYADRNPNAFIDLSRTTEKDFVVASQVVYHDAAHPSYIDLPVIPQTRERRWIDTPFPVARK
jgi:putative CocE/NonD family hydrolase